MLLTAGEAGVPGMSGCSSMGESLLSFPPSVRGGAPKAAGGGELLRGLSRAMCAGRIRLDVIMGGLSGRGAAAGVFGVEALKVLTMES